MQIVGNLSLEHTSFIGRAADLERLEALYDGQGQRLVTLLGPAGIGKTRLSRRYGATQQWAGSVWFCDLSPATDLEGLCAVVASALGVTPPPSADDEELLDVLAEALHGKGQALLICDNVEQVIQGAARAVEAWLTGAPELRFLVTSRERLRLPAEVVHELDHLSLPEEGEHPSEAVELFVERARQVRPGFSPTEEDAPVLATIVRQLDGLPLAIELAAARMRVLSPSALLERMGDRFALLRGTHRGADPRQATLWNALEWSWRLMSPWERRTLAQCAVFRGGFTLDAAEAVVQLSDQSAPLIMDVVQSLCDKSLVRTWEVAGGELRFGFYASVQAFAEKQLEAEGVDREALGERLARWALSAAERQAARAYGPAGREALAWLARERDNLSAVAHEALRRGDRSTALRALATLDPLVTSQGPYTHHLELLTRAMALDGEAEASLRARALEMRGNLRRLRGQLDEALEDLGEALPLAREGGDRAVEGSVVANLGIAVHERGRLDEAQALHAEARSIWAELGDRRREGRALGSLAILHQEQGRLDEAERCYQRALSIFKDEGDRRSEGIFLINLGELYKEQHHLPLARHHYAQALDIVQGLGDRRLEGVVMGNLGGIAQEEERLDEAQTLRERAVALLREVGDRRLEGVFTGYLGALHHARRHPERARDLYQDALTRLAEAGDRRFEGIFLGYLGAAEADLARAEAAKAAFARSEERLVELGDPLLLTALALHRVHLQIATARAQERLDDARRHRELARQMMISALRSGPGAADEGGASPGDPEATPAARSDEVRFALRLLEQHLEALGDELPEEPVSRDVAVREAAPEGAASGDEASGDEAEPPAGALWVGRDGRAFRLPDGETVSLGRRRAPRLILQRLVELRLDEEAESLSVYELMEAGWPGEKLHPEAGTNRVYVAVTTLRNLGLRDLLVYRDEGYTLDPSVPVAVVPPSRLAC